MDAHANLALTSVATSPVPPDSGTSLTVSSGTGLYFPAAPFNCTVWPTASGPTHTNAEIIRVTSVVGDSLTIVRAQEGTTARTIVVGDQIANTATAKTFTDIEGEFASYLTSAAAAAAYQPLNANLTSWASLAPVSKQDASANLTSWSALAPSAKQDSSANLNSWSALAPSSKQDSSANLTSWSALATSSKQDASANLTTWSGITPGTGIGTAIANATLTTIGLQIAVAQTLYP